MSIKQVLTSSWDFHARHAGNLPDIPELSFFTDAGVVSLEGDRSLLHLPTCRSEHVSVHNFQDGVHHRRFPCVCGDWRSNETEQFVRAFGWERGNPRRVEAKEVFEYNCPRVRFLN